MIALGTIFLIIGLFGLALGLIIDNDTALVTAGGALFLIGIIILVIGGVKSTNDYNRKANDINTKVTKSCLPYAVTHKHENDQYIVYSCANDNKIRVIKK